MNVFIIVNVFMSKKVVLILVLSIPIYKKNIPFWCGFFIVIFARHSIQIFFLTHIQFLFYFVVYTTS
jgi:hypothetical protein